MATVLNTFYPPQVDTFMPAFPYTETARVYFSISPYIGRDEIAAVQVSVVDQKTNRNCVSGGVVLQKDLNNYDEKGYYVDISPSELINNFAPNQFYKVQLRFSSEKIGNASVLNDAEVSNNLHLFSEWSTVCLIRPIYNCLIQYSIEDINGTSAGYSSKKEGLVGLTFEDDSQPTVTNGALPIVGQLVFENNNSKETLKSYRIFIYEINGDNTLLFESPVIYNAFSDNINSINAMIDISDMNTYKPESSYRLKIECTTTNEYIKTWETVFMVQSVQPTPYALSARLDENNGIVILSLNESETISDDDKSGYLYIKRAIDIDNFKKWDTIRVLEIPKDADEYKNFIENIKIIDNTVSSYHGYKYSVQRRTPLGRFESLNICEDIIVPKFFGAFFSRGNKQLRITFDYNVGQVTPTVNRTKVDTLGGRYPKFTENARLKYNQYSISGVISSQDDGGFEWASLDDEYRDLFMTAEIASDGIEKQDRTVLFNSEFYNKIYDEESKILENEKFECPHYYNNVYNMFNPLWERKFREEVIDWLNDGEPKLYRSQPEGNRVVMITDVSLTPKKELSRYIWDFSATMYEVEDGMSLDVLDKNDIYNIIDESIGSNTYADYKGREISYKKLHFYEWDGTGDLVDRAENIVNNYMYGKNYEVKQGATYISNVSLYITGPTQYLEEYQLYGYMIKVNGNDIFVPSHGYIQIPADIKVKSLEIPGAENLAIKSYFWLTSTNIELSTDLVRKLQFVRYTLGQESGFYDSSSTVVQNILQKYDYSVYKVTNTDQENTEGTKEIKTQEMMEYLQGLSVATAPYTKVEIKYEPFLKQNDSSPTSVSNTNLVINHTGYINLMNNFAIKDIKFEGRMFMLENTGVPREFECYNASESDDSIANITYFKNGKVFYRGQAYSAKVHNDDSSIPENMVYCPDMPVYAIINYVGKIIKVVY